MIKHKKGQRGVVIGRVIKEVKTRLQETPEGQERRMKRKEIMLSDIRSMSGVVFGLI